ncbi:glycosyltransferase family 1 protein [Candidatus Saccharibacteria bacterium HGW-Saccharibacteria-1]|jgi:hypothetical protein|nr:MAG: glycosyltransferase family 1 protein [Candidatus Saccharibacteria bacterium HGW-Saccharibacteria-1]
MKIWIDLTDFLNWRGNLTGIQRIQYNISKQYIESNDNVHFFVYKEDLRGFFEVEFNPDDIVKSGIVGGSKDGSTKLRPLISRLDGYLLKKMPASLSSKVVRARNSIKPVETTDCECVFGSDDTILIMGGIWVGNFINDLESLKLKNRFKLVHFAFDLIPSFFPGYVVEWLPETFTEYNKKVYSISEGILAISESTASDVRKFMQQHGIKNKPKIQVVRIGEGINTGSVAKEKSLSDVVGDNFILSVSTVEGRKNHAAFFYALKEAKRRGVDLPKIVIVGRDGWLTDDIRYIMKHDLDAQENIILLNNIDDNELSWLYKNCLFTVFPSFYEGWGMPIAEALSYGKLCLSSNTSSMPEIAGDLIDYFSPYNTGEILDCIIKYLDPDARLKKEEQISSNYRQTSWFDMYQVVSGFVSKISKK